MQQPKPAGPTCATCAHWQAQDRAASYMAPCAVKGRRVEFDDTCPAHQPPEPPREPLPALRGWMTQVKP